VRATSKNFFTPDQRRLIDDAVRDAEQKTSAEIVPVLATQADSYDRALFLAAVASMLLATLAVVALFLAPLENIFAVDQLPENWHIPAAWEVPLYILLPVQLIALVAGYYAAVRFPGFQRTFIPRAVMQRRVDQAAKQAFFAYNLTHTAGNTGILLYVALFEHLVVVLADRAINDKHSPENWIKVRDTLIQGLKSASPERGFVEAIAECGRFLEKDFPIQPTDANELPNHLRLN
jgi:putative membrane protein